MDRKKMDSPFLVLANFSLADSEIIADFDDERHHRPTWKIPSNKNFTIRHDRGGWFHAKNAAKATVSSICFRK